MYASMPMVVPQYPPPIPPEISNPKRRPLYGQVAYDPNYPSGRRHVKPVPIDADRKEQEASKATRPEVRFTLPRTDLTSSEADVAKEAQPSSAKPDSPITKVNEEILKTRLKLEQVKKRKEEAAKAGDNSTVADITYYVIPDLESQLENLLKEQHEGKKKRADHASSSSRLKKEKERPPHQTEVETESEHDDDQDLYG